MADNLLSRQGAGLAVTAAIALLVLVTIVFAAAFVATSTAELAPATAVDAQTYAREVAVVRDGASTSTGEALIEAFQCSVCHVLGANRVAPSFVDIADRATRRRPPMPAAQYLYESIVSPGAYLVEGYANAMPGNFADRLSTAEIGHIIAYLLNGAGSATR